MKNGKYKNKTVPNTGGGRNIKIWMIIRISGYGLLKNKKVYLSGDTKVSNIWIFKDD